MNISQQPILIVVATNDFYISLLAALLKSIEVNHKTDEKLEFIVIDDSVSQKNKNKIRKSAGPDISITWIPVSKVVPASYQLPADSSWFPLTALLRIFIPDMVSHDITKVLYLDVDMIVREDIAKLWHTDLGDRPLAAVQDICGTVCSPWAGIPNYAELGIPKETKYFNSGLLLLNPQKWRHQHIAKKVLEAITDNFEHTRFPDQYGLNVILYNQWVELDPRWNSFSIYESSDPFIIHFTGIKPIFSSYNANSDYQRIFLSYLRQTEWRGFKLIPGYRWLLKKTVNKTKKNGFRWLLKEVFNSTKRRFNFCF